MDIETKRRLVISAMQLGAPITAHLKLWAEGRRCIIGMLMRAARQAGIAAGDCNFPMDTSAAHFLGVLIPETEFCTRHVLAMDIIGANDAEDFTRGWRLLCQGLGLNFEEVEAEALGASQVETFEVATMAAAIA